MCGLWVAVAISLSHAQHGDVESVGLQMVMAASARTSSSCSSYTSSYSTGRTRLGSTTTVHHLADHHLQNQTYCDQVSLDEYEEQRLSGSQRHLATLLEDIVRDRNMASKDKKKRLKQVDTLLTLQSRK